MPASCWSPNRLLSKSYGLLLPEEGSRLHRTHTVQPWRGGFTCPCFKAKEKQSWSECPDLVQGSARRLGARARYRNKVGAVGRRIELLCHPEIFQWGSSVGIGIQNGEGVSGGRKPVKKAREAQEPREEQRNRVEQDGRGI